MTAPPPEVRPDDDGRAFVNALFTYGRNRIPATAEPAEPESPGPANHVPREGDNPRPPDPDRDMREFARALFNDHDY